MADAENQELKAGHAPAVKAGGKRIVQHKSPSDQEPPVENPQDEEQAVAERPEVDPLIVSGYLTKGNKDFPPEAIKSFHNKPMPTHEKNHVPAVRQQINQPRKQ